MKGPVVMYAKCGFISLIAFFSLTSASAVGEQVKGMIDGRRGDTLTVKTDQGSVTVLLTEDTKAKDVTGVFGLRSDEKGFAVLIPGLKVDIDGTPGENGIVIAKTITVDGDDLESSQMIQAGLNPTAKQVEANIEAIDANKRANEANRVTGATNASQIAALKEEIDSLKAAIAEHKQNSATHEKKITESIQAERATTERFMSLGDYDVKNQAVVKFASGSTSIPKESEEELKKLATTATGLDGYFISVIGHADSSGNDALNTKLSKDRADAVMDLLMTQGGIPATRIVAPGAMGEYAPVASNETAAGRAENRRVDVKVLVHK